MSQFMLCVPSASTVPLLAQLELRPISKTDSWLTAIANELFPDDTDVRVPHLKSGESISAFFTKIHNAVYNGRLSETTELELIIGDAVGSCRSLLLWWGDEWSDLPIVVTERLVPEILRQLREPSGEVYLRWTR